MNIYQYGIVYNRYTSIKWDKEHGAILMPHKIAELKRLKAKLRKQKLLKKSKIQ